jgi:hypothetical protein
METFLKMKNFLYVIVYGSEKNLKRTLKTIIADKKSPSCDTVPLSYLLTPFLKMSRRARAACPLVSLTHPSLSTSSL